MHTALGTGLFDFGFRDGPGGDERESNDAGLLQHPLGVTALRDGSVVVCDTYNGAVRRYAPVENELTTLALDLAEPSGAHPDGDALVVVESAAHRLTRIALAGVVTTDGFAHTTQRPVTDLAADVLLEVSFTPPPGQKIDDRFGPAAQLFVSATPPALLRSGEGRGTVLIRALELDPNVGNGVLHIAARAASCDADVDGGVPEGAACHLVQQDWGVPVRVVADGPAGITLPLGGA